MKKNYVFTGVTGYCLTGATNKREYKIDRVLCNEHSSYINWVEDADISEHSVSIKELLDVYFEKLERENG